MKKRLYERRSKKKDIFIITINGFLMYLLLSWDFVFGDVFALAPGYLLTLIYTLPKSGYVSIIISTVYAFVWSLYYPSYLWLSPILFIVFSLIMFVYTYKRKAIKEIFPLFYIMELIFCLWFYNQLNILSTQYIQFLIYIIIFIHIKASSDRK